MIYVFAKIDFYERELVEDLMKDSDFVVNFAGIFDRDIYCFHPIFSIYGFNKK